MHRCQIFLSREIISDIDEWSSMIITDIMYIKSFVHGLQSSRV